jgi:predicted Zn-dependent protease
LHELLVKSSNGFRIPFLSSHPSSDERIENLRALINMKRPTDMSAPSVSSRSRDSTEE